MNNNDNTNNSQHLKTLAANVEEIATTLESVHGVNHKHLVLLFFTMHQNISQLEEIACHASHKLDAEADHSIVHMLSSSIIHSLFHLCISIQNTHKEHKTLDADVQMLIKRANEDWHSKIDRHNNDD